MDVCVHTLRNSAFVLFFTLRTPRPNVEKDHAAVITYLDNKVGAGTQTQTQTQEKTEIKIKIKIQTHIFVFCIVMCEDVYILEKERKKIDR